MKKKINIINIQEKIKKYLNKNKDVKSSINLNEKNKKINNAKNISLYKNNCFINGNKISDKKNIISNNKCNQNNNKDRNIKNVQNINNKRQLCIEMYKSRSNFKKRREKKYNFHRKK